MTSIIYDASVNILKEKTGQFSPGGDIIKYIPLRLTDQYRNK